MSIHRYPNLVNRGDKKFCQECEKDKAKGYWLYWQEAMPQAVFVCDDCLKAARSEKVFDAKKGKKER